MSKMMNNLVNDCPYFRQVSEVCTVIPQSILMLCKRFAENSSVCSFTVIQGHSRSR